ncbi:MAG TPA: DUF1549 domain-containing protein [Planctomycetaceae bacterium]|jgi:hypothetical protein|nr:DUF1549 domain-containing protein [Planctomycetaceae bacterium]
MTALRTAARFTIIALGIVGTSVGLAVCASTNNTPTGGSSAPSASAVKDQKLPSKSTEQKTLEPISNRFAAAISKETPSFQRHVVPLLGKLGCNGRACHGSFQGRGGFRLSLFGYDFKMDHDALMANVDGARVDVHNPDASLILQKPTMRIEHEGGKRYELGSWEHHVLAQWIQRGATGVKPSDAKLTQLEVRPSEIHFSKKGEHVTLRAIAHWSDGSSEDVTPLCRYQSNDEQIAKIDTTGLVTSVDVGDSHVVAFYDAGVTPVAVVRPVSDVVGPKYPDVPTPTQIDWLVVKKLRKLGIVPSELANDSDFLRRVSLDLTGSLPTADEVVAFLADKSPDKRHRKIDELLERPTYVAWWTTRLCDLTGNNDRALANITPVNQLASQEWYDWVLKRVRENVPYDKLVEGIVLATSRPRSQTYAEYSNEMTALYRKTPEGNYAYHVGLTHFWARRNIAQPQQKALSFAYTFLGIRIQCAECHKHPFDQWTQDDYKDFTKFFTRVRYGTDPSDAAERKQLSEALHLDSKKQADIRREYPRLIAEGKVLPFDELFIQPLRTRGSLRAQKPGALRPRTKVVAKPAKKTNGAKAKMADANGPRKPAEAQKPLATGTKPIIAQRDEKKPGDAKLAKPGSRPEAKKPAERKPILAMRPGQLNAKVAKADKRNPQPTAELATARLLGAGNVDLTKYDDPRSPLMDWLRSKNNRFFARAFVNRVWANYFNVGIVDPPDNLSLANPPSNAELLDYLAEGFVKHNYDMKWLHREITNSRTYQLSWQPNATNRLDQRNFSHAVLRRLPAEVAYDAVRQATSSDQTVTAMRTDCSDRAIGSPSIRRGGRGFSPYALGLFGRSVRESNCDCDRSNEPSLLQTVFLRNDNEVLAMVSNPRFGWVSQIVAQLQPKPQRPARPSAKNPAKAAPPQAMNAKSPTNSSDKNLLAMATPEQKKSVAKDAPPKDPAKKDAARKDLVKKDSAKKDARKPEMFTPEQKTRRIAQLTERIRQLQEKGDAKQVKLLTARLEDLKRQPARARAAAAPVAIPKPSQLPLPKKQELVRTLYLRTLSRYPKDQEFDRALAYLDKSDNVANGLRDLVWAVVNTEEFIVNH